MIWWISAVVVFCILLGLNLWLTGQFQRRALQLRSLYNRGRRRRRPTPPPNAIAPSVRGRNLRTPRRSWPVVISDEVRSRGGLGGIFLFAIVVVALFLFIFLKDGFSAAPESTNLVVAIAPFTAPDGSPAPEGKSVMQGLVAEWSTGDSHRLTRPLSLIPLDQTIPDAQAAFETATRLKADVVIWGSVEPGGSASDATHRPRLLWWPRRALPTDRSLSVRERLAMPVVYDLAVETEWPGCGGPDPEHPRPV